MLHGMIIVLDELLPQFACSSTQALCNARATPKALFSDHIASRDCSKPARCPIFIPRPHATRLVRSSHTCYLDTPNLALSYRASSAHPLHTREFLTVIAKHGRWYGFATHGTHSFRTCLTTSSQCQSLLTVGRFVPLTETPVVSLVSVLTFPRRL